MNLFAGNITTLEKALTTLRLKNKVIAQNIANSDIPKL